MPNIGEVIEACCADVSTYQSREHVLRVLHALGYNGYAAEIGTFGGEFSERILQRTMVRKLYCVDPYASYQSYVDHTNGLDLEHVFGVASARLAPYGDRVEILRRYSTDAAGECADGSLDFCYIDGNHAYDYVLSDICHWFPKIKSGGLIIGDDAVDPLNDPGRRPDGNVERAWDRNNPSDISLYGVTKAFVDFARNTDVWLTMYGTQIFMIKP